jgi:hypothetical protein
MLNQNYIQSNKQQPDDLPVWNQNYIELFTQYHLTQYYLPQYYLQPDDLPVWNFDGSSTEQAEGKDSDVFLVPRAVFRDPFRGGNHVLVLAECYDNQMKPAIG